ncbi:MAG: hypothetical protein V4481_00245 [Patescibacteria group bacterium]
MFKNLIGTSVTQIPWRDARKVTVKSEESIPNDVLKEALCIECPWITKHFLEYGKVSVRGKFDPEVLRKTVYTNSYGDDVVGKIFIFSFLGKVLCQVGVESVPVQQVVRGVWPFKWRSARSEEVAYFGESVLQAFLRIPDPSLARYVVTEFYDDQVRLIVSTLPLNFDAQAVFDELEKQRKQKEANDLERARQFVRMQLDLGSPED